MPLQRFIAPMLPVLWLFPAPLALADDVDLADLLKKGDKLLASLPKKPGVNYTRYYDIRENEKSIGYCIITFKAADIDGRPGYTYEYEYCMDHPRRGQVEYRMTARLNDACQPVALDQHVDTFSLQRGAWNHQYDITFGTKRALIEPLSSGEKLPTKKVRLPRGRFTLPMGDMLELLPLKSGQTFALRVFNPQTQKFQISVHEVKKQKGRLRVGVKGYNLSELEDQEEEDKDGDRPEQSPAEGAEAEGADGSGEKEEKKEKEESHYFIIDKEKGFVRFVEEEDDTEIRVSTKKKVLQKKKQMHED